ncbi:SusC/RagA family TonB-linked outer membrane protein [Parabacteroides sp. Marseille-P3160]|uniref:SusC/RagA family TonB-linked outer membrane protein n=1 Tax=Parabacteroides sp. Marseille-P3160 TaxID=1917887 RepID=UPI0009BC3119|nr:SusC/RagA family TonB-linked outer membrane protein [Parabacteroides sp. Marseille-P3160]
MNQFKFYSFLLLLMFLLLYTPLYAMSQEVLPITSKNISLKEFIKEIEAKTDYTFIFDNSVNMASIVSGNLKKGDVSEILNEALKESEIHYQISGYQIILKNKKETDKIAGVNQKKIITGIVVDEQGEPLIAATVKERGGQNATITDTEGKFSIDVTSGSILEFIYIGYNPQQVAIGNQASLTIKLLPSSKNLDEVVVVGYGVQKKINLTGAIGIVTSEELVKRPITNVSTGLQGLVPGMTVTASANGGLPGQSSASIQIRGVGSRGNNNPLILIDGAEGDMNIINPNDIESISVLKDAASSAIYGNRAANGVILITTKNVTGKDRPPRINIDTYIGTQEPIKMPKMVDSPTFMAWENEAQANVGGNQNYSQADIQKTIDGSDPNYYANTNWIDATFKSSAPQYNLNLSVDGKAQNMGYLISYGYLDQNGLTVGESTNSKRHNIRLKLHTKVADRFEISANMGYINRNYTAPNASFEGTGGVLYNAMRTRPLVPVRFTDGRWGYGGGQSNQVAYLTDGGAQNFSSQEFTGNFSLKADLLKGWTASMNYITRQSNSFRELLSKTIRFYYPETENLWYTTNTPNSLENRDYRTLSQNLFAQTDYEIKIGNHSFHAMGGYQQEWQRSNQFNASRKNLVTEKDPVLDFGSADTQANSASADHWAMRSGFGRINYIFKDRYLFEANLRYDLTSRFIKKNRAEWFPSFSAGWRISEENFMSRTKDYLDQLKLRVSWGTLGNQFSTGSDNYPYLSRIAYTSVPTIGTLPNDGYAEMYIGNPNLLWEMVYTTNIGLDANLLNNRLSFTGDYYVRETRRMIYQRELPGVIGSPSTMDENGGKMQNKGWEIQLGWQDRIDNDFEYGATFSLADVRNKITEWDGVLFGSNTITTAGYSNLALYGLVADGIAVPTDFEKYNPVTGKYENPKFPIMSGDAGLVQPGDIKYKDLDNSGTIDLDNDRKVLGSSIPRYTFSFKGNMAYKGIDFSFLIQGVGKVDGYIYGPARHAFTDQSTYPQWFHADRYQASNPNPNASYPRFTYNQSYNQRFSTFWMEDASYLRMKNIQIGYTLPSRLTRIIRIDKCRFYASADNLFTISDYFSSADPEIPIQAGGNYPQIRTYVFGVNITLH